MRQIAVNLHQRALLTIVSGFALLLALTGCGFFGGNGDAVTADVAPAAGTVAAGPATVLALNNQNWNLALQDADRYRGSPVDLTGQVFYVIGDYEGAIHYQIFTDPATRAGNTHVAVPTGGPQLREGDQIHVIGTLERMLVVSSRGGSDLRLPYVTAGTVEVLGDTTGRVAGATAVALVTPIASPASPSPVVTATVAPPTATAPPAKATPLLAPPTATISDSAQATSATPSATETAPTALELPAIGFTLGSGMVATGDASAPNGQFIASSTGSREWNGSGSLPKAGTATFPVYVPQGGRYAVWVEMNYQNVDANSLWLVVDNQRGVLLGNEDSGYRVWKWVGWRDGNVSARVSVDLTAGVHTVTIVSREAGTRFSDLMLTQDLNYKPADTAAAATGSADTGSSPADQPTATPPPAAMPANSVAAATGTASATPTNVPPTATAQPVTQPSPTSAAATSAPTSTPLPTTKALPSAASTTAVTATATNTPVTKSTTAQTPTATNTPTAKPTGTPAPTVTPAPTATTAATSTAPGGSYTVQSGDTLSAIAARVYGDASQYQRIYEANRDKLSSPDRIAPGQQLRIPK